MGRLAAIFGALLGVLLVPLALASPTAWLLLPAHLVFTLLATAAALGEGLAGRPGRARAWGALYLLASVAMVGALEAGAQLAQSRYWMLPWAGALLWGWLPPVAALAGGWAGEGLVAWRSRRAVRRRRRLG